MLRFFSFLVIFLFGFVSSSIIRHNNVCKKLEHYPIRYISPHCWYDPDVNATADALASNHGYKLEKYEVVTEDGYILTVFRIPPREKVYKGIVYLQHPAASSATVWLDLGDESLAFLLANQGYDVWMGNFRGTTYSLKHVKLSHRHKKYWDFSFHEMGMYDLPAMLHLVSRETGSKEKVIYVGHSVGTTTAFVYSSMHPANASAYVKAFILWSPIAYLRHSKSIIVLLAPFADFIMFLGKLTGQLSGTTANSLDHRFLEFFCFNVNARFCSVLLQLVGGPDPHFAPARLPVEIYQNFAGFSLKSTVHYLQLVRDKERFQRFSYGRKENRKRYGSDKPPVYPLENINVSMTFIYGGNDYCATKKDAIYTYNKLPKKVRCGISEIAPYNHFDFHYATDVKVLAYQKTIDIIDSIMRGTNNTEMCKSNL